MSAKLIGEQTPKWINKNRRIKLIYITYEIFINIKPLATWYSMAVSYEALEQNPLSNRIKAVVFLMTKEAKYIKKTISDEFL